MAVAAVVVALAAIALWVIPRDSSHRPGQVPGASSSTVDVRTLGARGDGVTDDTDVLRRAVAGGNKIVVVPPGTYLVSGQIDVPSNTTLRFATGASLLAQVRNWRGDALLGIHDGHDITVIGGVLDGRKDVNPTGYMFGVVVDGGSSRVRFQGTTARNMPARDPSGGNGGDGFYMSSGTDIRFESVTADGNVRQGMSITGSVSDVLITDSVFSNTTGTRPGAGLDIEPNPGGYTIRDVHIVRSSFVGNNRGALITGRSDPSGRMEQISIERCVFSRNRLEGVSVVSSPQNQIEDLTFTRNQVDGNGAWGLHLEDRVGAVVEDNRIRFNAKDGVLLETDPLTAVMRGNRIARNDWNGANIVDSSDFHLTDNGISLNGFDGALIEYRSRGDFRAWVGRNHVWNNGVSALGRFDGIRWTSLKLARCDCRMTGNIIGNDRRGARTQGSGIAIGPRVRHVRTADNVFRRNLRHNVPA